jgi:BirA family transcriptional regulator, biotin operon repressor / biotin---[acetyl-CoA-carboxylase] ligase
MDRYAPWHPACLICEGEGSRVWVSGSGSREKPLYLAGELRSSLDAGWHLLKRGCFPVWASILAALQTRGRGQLRREWHSPPGNVYAAMRLPGGFPWEQGLLPILVGYLMLEGLSERGFELRIKWPNDLLLEGRKVGGILVEEKQGVCLAGVGINLSSVELPSPGAGAAAAAGSLDQAGRRLTPAALWCVLVQSAESCYESLLSSSTSSEFISLVQQHLAFLGRRVAVAGQPDIQGRVAGISDSGGLLLRAGGRDSVVSSGSIVPVDS